MSILAEQILGFIPSVIKKNPSYGEYIEYAVFNPVTLQMDRQRIRLNRLRRHFSTATLYRQHVTQVLCTINAKLSGGWTPFGETHDSRELIPLNQAINAYIDDKKRELRDASMVSYSSVCNILLEWLATQNMDEIPTNLFNNRIALRFMDELLLRPKFNNNTYNTYLKKYRACFNWLVERGYCKENPFEKIKTKRKQEKMRGLIPADAREKVLQYVRTSKEPNFEIVMHLVFSSLIRPTEIERIQIKDIDLKNACIRIPADKAKTHIERFAPMSDASIQLISDLLAKGYPGEWYLLGSTLVPSKDPCYHGKFKKAWIKIREKCELPADMQLYSLKDSGITELLEAGVDTLTVMQAADHHDLTTTTKYACHRNSGMIDKVRNAKVAL